MPQNKQELVSRRCDKWMPHTPHIEVGEIKEPAWQPADSPRLVIYHQCDGRGYGIEAWEERRCAGRLAHAGHSWTANVSAVNSTVTVWCTGQITGPAPSKVVSPIPMEGRYEP